MMKFYDCPTCHNLNGAWRLHCQSCGTIPAMYSPTGKPEPSIVPAHGCIRAESIRTMRTSLKTVKYDYYAGA